MHHRSQWRSSEIDVNVRCVVQTRVASARNHSSSMARSQDETHQGSDADRGREKQLTNGRRSAPSGRFQDTYSIRAWRPPHAQTGIRGRPLQHGTALIDPDASRGRCHPRPMVSFSTGPDQNASHVRSGWKAQRHTAFPVPRQSPTFIRSWMLRGRPTDAPLKNAPFSKYVLSKTFST